MKRKPLIAGNWKMHKTIKEAVYLVNLIKRELLDFDKVDIVVCPPFTALSNVYEIIMETNIKLGAQNLFWEEEGAFTGEVSAKMIKDCGAEYVIIGHSERRRYFFEDEQIINKKIKVALKNNLLPIVCVGETLKEREENKTINIVESQLEGAFKDLNEDEMFKIIIAYEPVWAIGTGKTATPKQAQEVQGFIRDWLEKKFSKDLSQNLRILYGGSIKPSNIKDLMKEEDIDGGLVGGASLEADSFIEIVKNSLV
jgi:triosephosphate isomerase